MKVLIAEDNPLWRNLLERNVSNWGFDAVIAQNGREAWEILQRADAPRLAVLDWEMPEMDGIDVCKRVKQSENLPFTYVLMLTSRDDKEDMVAGLDAGADDYLTKPVEPRVLKSRLTAAWRIVEVVPPKEWSMPRVPGYDVKKLLGKGAFATVWEATQTSTERRCALKVIRVDLATDEVFRRFAREIGIAQKLEHPNIAQIYDSRIDQQLGYIAMEMIDGLTLDKYVKERQPNAARILHFASEVCSALEHAHRRGIVHRDLKPSNIMLTPEGQPKLLDFGLARTMFEMSDDIASAHSMDGTVIGTPLFMAPEQARGENESLDGRADVYGLGIILYLMLLRRHPHKVDVRDRWRTIRQIAEGRVRKPSEVRPDFNRDLEAILMKALAEEPENRYATAAEFGDALLNFLRQRAVASHQRDAAVGKVH
jgi:serine/threonine protein kinase